MAVKHMSVLSSADRTKVHRDTSEARILEFVTESYRQWRKARWQGIKQREPRITATYIAEVLDVSERLKPLYVVSIQNKLTALVRKGLLETSLGEGLNGRETRLYNPKDEK